MYLSNLHISKHLAYRDYNEILVVMNWKTKGIHILRHNAIKLWKKIEFGQKIDKNEIDNDNQLIDTFLNSGLIVSSEIKRSTPQKNITRSLLGDKTDQQILNKWAARNFIPINGAFEVTGQCNLKCVHCYSLHKQKHILSTKQIFQIIDDLKANGTLALTLTGGEFFLRSDYNDILKYLCEHKFSIRINTNGSLIDEQVIKNIEDAHQLSHINLSIYSANPIIHDQITRKQGSHSKTVKALHLLKDSGKIVRINCSVMKSNFISYRTVKTEIGDKLGIQVRYDSRLVPLDNGDTENLKERIDDGQMESFYNWVLDSGIADRATFLNPKRKSKSDEIGLCSSGFSYFGIGDDGQLYPCFQLRVPLGNLLENKFSHLWKNSSFLQQLRSSTKKTQIECSECKLKSSCNLCIGMSYLEDGDIFGKSKECCRDTLVRNKIAKQRGFLELEPGRR